MRSTRAHQLKRQAASTGSVLIMALAWGTLPAADIIDAIDFHGFLSQGYLRSTHNNYLGNTTEGSFNLAEIGFNAGYDLTDKLRLGIQFFGRDFYESENANKVIIDYAYGDYHHNQYIGLRLGRVKQPFGFFNEVQDLDMTRTAMIMPQAVYDTRARDYKFGVNGGSLYGNLPLSSFGSFDYNLWYGNTAVPSDGTTAQQYERTDTETQYIRQESSGGAQGIWNAPLDGLRFGYSYSQARGIENKVKDMAVPVTTNPQNRDFLVTIERGELHVFSVEYNLGDLVLTGEYMRDNAYLVLDFANNTFKPDINEEVRAEGFYLQATYRVHPMLELGTYYSMFYEDRHHHGQDNFNAFQRDIALSARIDLTHNWLFKLEAHWMRGTALLNQADRFNNFQQPIGTEYWWLFGARTTYSF